VFMDHYNDFETIKNFVFEVKKDLSTQPTEQLVVQKKLSKEMQDYTNHAQHITALKNSHATLPKGGYVQIIYVKDPREVLHYEKELNLQFELDYNKYFDNFFKGKIEYIDAGLHYKLFLQKIKLIDSSQLNIQRKIRGQQKQLNKLI
jgi:DNA polymerase elongation subunit (family B)